MSVLMAFLATLVALHFTPVSKWVSESAEFRTSVASRLASLFYSSSYQRFKIRVFCLRSSSQELYDKTPDFADYKRDLTSFFFIIVHTKCEVYALCILFKMS